MSYAIIKTGGKQFAVESGQTLRVPTINAEAGKKVDIDTLLTGTTAAAGTVKATVYIAERGATGYNILINAPSEPVTGVQRWVMDYNFPQCPLWEKVNSNREERPEKFYLPQIEFLATFDPEHPGSLKGTQTVKDSRGGSVTYTWDLQQCK